MTYLILVPERAPKRESSLPRAIRLAERLANEVACTRWYLRNNASSDESLRCRWVVVNIFDMKKYASGIQEHDTLKLQKEVW
jgi:hypothetical protein